MKVIKPFFLGGLGGLALAVALLTGLFFSPLRERVYFAADPEMADIRSKLDQYRQWLAQTDLRIAVDGAAAPGRVSDSLQAAQIKAWRDYKGWRNRLGDLAREHVNATAEGFWPWIYSLRFWILPMGLALCLLPGLLLAWRARSPFRSGRAKPPVKTARAQALSNFEDAIKKVARISDTDRGNAPPPRLGETRMRQVTGMEPPTEALPASAFPEAIPREPSRSPQSQEPETVPIAQLGDPDLKADPGHETRFLEVGPGWGESLNQPGERIGGPGAPINPPSRLAMEDEDVADARAAASGDEDDDEDESLGAMPPTTEVERVERRKDQVLKLARRGLTSSEISRRMRISQDQVEFIIRLRREKG